MKILISISAPDVANELCEVLNAEGYECVVCRNASMTIEDVYLNSPGMIILDVAISQPSVCELLSKLKSAPSTRDIPVLILASKRYSFRLAKCYELGAFDYISYPIFRAELLARIRNIAHVTEKMREVESLLVRDYLTGLYNRKFFMERFNEEIAWAARYNEPLSLMVLDIDHFKKINDTYGHSCGDEVLKKLASTLSGLLRAHDVLARYGGEEFVVLLSNTTEQEAYLVGEKLRVGVQETDFYCESCEGRLPITISVGVATAEDLEDLSVESLINRADAALYAAKSSGRNRVISAQNRERALQDEG